MRRFATGVLLAVPAYIIGAAGGAFLVSMFSSNTHDRSLEAVMTGAFFIGPIVGILGFVAGIARSKANTRGSDEGEDGNGQDRAGGRGRRGGRT